MTCDAFWLESPAILWAKADEFFPFTELDRLCTSTALNAFTRFGLYLGVALALVRLQVAWLAVGLVFAALAAVAWFVMNRNGTVREGFGALVDPTTVDGRSVPDIIGLSPRTPPTIANPFMNVLVSEYPTLTHGELDRHAASSDMDRFFETQTGPFKDAGDTFNHTQSQRQWYTMPSTTIPNDQDSYQNWLFRVPGQTCKEGNMSVCYPVIGGQELPWREFQHS